MASLKNGRYELREDVGGLQTPKTPNAFARFVKDNYKHYRTPGSTHKDAMAVLSQQFASTKI